MLKKKTSGRPKKDPADQYSEVVQVRLLKHELLAIKELAGTRTISTVVRELLLNAIDGGAHADNRSGYLQVLTYDLIREIEKLKERAEYTLKLLS